MGEQGGYGLVLVAGADDEHVAVVFGGGPQQADAADVDFLDDVGLGGSGGHGFLKRVQIHHHQIDGRDAVFGGLGHVGGFVAAVQNAPEYDGMQGFDPSAKHLGEAGEGFDGRHGRALVFEKLLGAAGRVKRYAVLPQQLRQRGQPVFVIDGEQGGANGAVRHGSVIYC